MFFIYLGRIHNICRENKNHGKSVFIMSSTQADCDHQWAVSHFDPVHFAPCLTLYISYSTYWTVTNSTF